MALRKLNDPAGNKRPIDNVHIFPEPDADIVQLCYKRLQRRRHVDTMAFPDFRLLLRHTRKLIIPWCKTDKNRAQ